MFVAILHTCTHVPLSTDHYTDVKLHHLGAGARGRILLLYYRSICRLCCVYLKAVLLYEPACDKKPGFGDYISNVSFRCKS